MSRPSCVFPMVDSAGRSFLFVPNATFMLPDIETIVFTMYGIATCGICGCTPCLGKFVKTYPSLVFKTTGRALCESIPFAVVPELWYSLIHCFEAIDGEGGVALTQFSLRLALALDRARVVEYEVVASVYQLMGYAFPDLDFLQCSIADYVRSNHSWVFLEVFSVLECLSKLALCSRDTLLQAIILHTFNVSHDMACFPHPFVAMGIIDWIDRVLSVSTTRYSEVVVAVASKGWSLGRTHVDQVFKSEVSSLPVNSCVYVWNHVDTVSFVLPLHNYSIVLPWMTVDHPKGIFAGVMHCLVRHLVKPGAGFVEHYGFYNRYRLCEHETSRFLGRPFVPLECPKSGCVPVVHVVPRFELGDNMSFSAWVGAVEADVLSVTDGCLVCHHSGSADEWSFQNYTYIRRVLNDVGEKIVDHVRIGTHSVGEELSTTKRLKQARLAPTSQCLGIAEAGPFCNEMGLLLR